MIIHTILNIIGINKNPQMITFISNTINIPIINI